MLITCFWIEHHDLYQLNINKAKNVFLGLEQGESPYWQGTGNTVINPAPWTDSLLPSDPDFSWCAASDVQVRINLLNTLTCQVVLAHKICNSAAWLYTRR